MKVTHSATSQTIAAMRQEELVDDAPSEDARMRRIKLTTKACEAMPLLKAGWRATESAIAEVEREIPYAMTSDIRAAVARRTFIQRLHDNLRPAR
ncbi:hypothetical protein AB0M47_17835 [Hamadaea sp. NPDC051192]|uniref:hypothetical protein n=1 Tax=Hamadaea sp. NPDC051192 TaxID=3154940 RepID=UPI0034317919